MPMAEAAELLGASESAVLQDVKEQRLDGLDRGRGRRPRYVASRSAVERLIAAGGRPDRRSRRDAQAQPPTPPIEQSADTGDDRSVLLRDLDAALAEVARLSAENDQLRLVARNANVSVLAQTESVQQLLATQDALSRG